MLSRFSIALTFAIFWLAVPGTAADDPHTVRRDTQFPVELHGSIKSSSAKVGDKVEFRTDEAILIGNNVVVPENAVILGTVVEVKHHAPDEPHSLLRIKIHTLRWKNGEAPLNAMVASVRRGHMLAVDTAFRHTPTFMDGIRIVSHKKRDAYTEFLSDRKEITLRSGVGFVLRQIDPADYPEREFNVYTPDDQKTAQNFVPQK